MPAVAEWLRVCPLSRLELLSWRDDTGGSENFTRRWDSAVAAGRACSCTEEVFCSMFATSCGERAVRRMELPERSKPLEAAAPSGKAWLLGFADIFIDTEAAKRERATVVAEGQTR